MRATHLKERHCLTETVPPILPVRVAAGWGAIISGVGWTDAEGAATYALDRNEDIGRRLPMRTVVQA